jgi:anthraniloyl-CoA monooxygenase
MLAPELDGEPVLCGPSFRWLTFELLKSRRWVHENVVLIGDAAHTSHFSRGFGTHLAVGDARCLARHLNGAGSVGYALEAFERERRPEVARHQAVASSSSNFYRSVIHAYERGTRSAIRDAIDQVERETRAAAPPSAPS